MRRLFSTTMIAATVLLAGALPVLSADPLGIDKKIDEGIENIARMRRPTMPPTRRHQVHAQGSAGAAATGSVDPQRS